MDNEQSYSRLLMYLTATLLISISMGMNAIIFPISMEKLAFPEYIKGFVLAGETSALFLICFTLQWVLKHIGLFVTVTIALLLRIGALYLVSSATLDYQWLSFVFIHGLGAYIAVLMLQILITSMRFKKYNTVINAMFGMMISLGYSIGPLLVEFSKHIPSDNNLNNLTRILINPQHEFALSVVMSIAFSILAGAIMLIARGNIPGKEKGKAISLLSIIASSPGVYSAIAYCGVVIFGITAFITIYGIRNGMEVYSASLLLVAFITGCIVLEPVYAWISRHFELRHFLFTNIFVSLLFSAFLPIVIYDFNQSVILLFLWGGANASCYSVSMSILISRFNDNQMVAANAAFSLMDSLGGTIGTILIGFAMHTIGAEGLAYTMMLASLLYFSYGLTRYRVT